MEDDPEFWYLVRLSYGHLIEGLDALGRWRQHSLDVQAFLRRLPQDTNRKRVESEKCISRVSNKAVERARHRTFHYPSPNPQKQPDFDSELEQVLKALGDEQATVVAPQDEPTNLRLFFADKAALLFALGRAVDDETLRKESQVVVDGCLAFVHFVDGAVATYLSERS